MVPAARADRTLRVLGLVSLVLFAIHAGHHVLRREVHDLLWMCNLSTLVLGVGCLTANARLAAIPLLWLCYGTPMWIVDLLGGTDLMVTSCLPHVGGPVLGMLAVRRLGLPRGTWWRAFLFMLALAVLARGVTEPQYNVMVSFSVWPGWEDTFPRYAPYAAFLLGLGAASFLLVEVALGWAMRSAKTPIAVPGRAPTP